MSDRRNPYFILGVDFGTTGDHATSAFAHASRRLKSRPDAPYELEDAAWALSVLERATDPEQDLEYFRVPADPNAYVAPSGGSLLELPATPLGRATAPSTVEERTLFEDASLAAALAEDLDSLGRALMG